MCLVSLQNKEMLTKFSSKLYKSVDGHWKHLFTSQISSHNQVEWQVMYWKWVFYESLWKHFSDGCLLDFCNKKKLAECVLNSCRIKSYSHVELMLCWQWSVDQSQVPNNLLFMQLSSLKPFGSEDIDAPHNLCCSSSVHVPFLDTYSSATTSMIPELPSEPFVKRCHVRVLRAFPCVSLSSFVNCVKTSMSLRVRIILLDLLPLPKQRASQSTISQTESERDESRTRQAQWNHERRLPSALATGSTFLCLSMSISL